MLHTVNAEKQDALVAIHYNNFVKQLVLILWNPFPTVTKQKAAAQKKIHQKKGVVMMNTLHNT